MNRHVLPRVRRGQCDVNSKANLQGHSIILTDVLVRKELLFVEGNFNLLSNHMYTYQQKRSSREGGGQLGDKSSITNVNQERSQNTITLFSLQFKKSIMTTHELAAFINSIDSCVVS